MVLGQKQGLGIGIAVGVRREPQVAPREPGHEALEHRCHLLEALSAAAQARLGGEVRDLLQGVDAALNARAVVGLEQVEGPAGQVFVA